MIRPPYLKEGDKVGIVAPARKINADDLDVFHAVLESWGLRWKHGKNLFQASHQYSGTDEQRAADIQDMVNDKEIKAIFCARGGYGSLRSLLLVDFTEFQKNPKWLVGFSDISVFHAYLNTYLGVESLHAMMPAGFNGEPDDHAIASLKKALFGEAVSFEFSHHKFNRSGDVTGTLTGGNLSILYSLNGTNYFPDLRNKILFIEEVDEYLYHIDRMMMNLFVSGVFNKINGLIVGGLTKMRDNEIPFGKTAEQIISEVIEGYEFPVCFGFPAGHQKNNNTLIFGRQASLSIKDIGCSLEFNA